VEAPVNERSSVDGVLEWTALGRGLVAEHISGDAHAVVATSYGALAVVVDALGHGHEAAQTARAGIAAIREAAESGLDDVILALDHSVRRMRGVVASLARIEAATSQMTWVGIGNVTGVAVRRRGPATAIPQRGGVIGGPHIVPKAGHVALSRGDVIIFSTDGIRDGYSGDIVVEHDVSSIASDILTKHSRGTDDALVLVAKYLGGS
jgi:serine phosphatase RsbU (regulator of sigma subunit)